MVILFFNFLRNFPSVFRSVYIILHAHQQSTKVLISLQAHRHLFSVCLFVYNGHSNGYKVISYCDLHFPNDWWYWASFCVCILYICVFSLEKCLFKSVAHFLVELFVLLLLNCKRFLYFLEMNPFQIYDLQILSLFHGLPFPLLIVSFDVCQFGSL